MKVIQMQLQLSPLLTSWADAPQQYLDENDD